MKTIIHGFTMTLCVLSTHLFAQNKQDEIVAVWDTGEAKVEIYHVDDRYIGNPINAEGERNPDIEILNLEYKEGKWVGTIYARRKNKRLDVECQVEGDVLHLEVDAGLLSRELEWLQVN
uniref:DUF2147 domain-containing protein n=1 Tax=Roseihalotalea indica TaxID=2867963 RepID=A0AA49Q0B4_9BACT|nr:hypothetical protein K4G66_16515 [Tunicatimonas sp. TK19036]